MKITTETGEELDFGHDWAKSATQYARSKGLQDVWVARSKSEYVLFIAKPGATTMEPVYASREFEAIGVHIDVLAVDRSFREREESDRCTTTTT